jgi:hypothetical protein
MHQMSHFPTIGATGAQINALLHAAVPEAIATGNPFQPVWAPGFERRGGFMPLEDLLTDDMSDGSGFLRHGVLALLKAALTSTDPAIRISTQALVNEWAKRHAEYHIDEALENARVAA